MFISVISLGEIEKGTLILRAFDPRRSQKLTAWLSKVEQRFSERILPLDATTLHVWAQITATAELAGQPLPVMDKLLMATAQCHGLTAVTRNAQDFALYPASVQPLGAVSPSQQRSHAIPAPCHSNRHACHSEHK